MTGRAGAELPLMERAVTPTVLVIDDDPTVLANLEGLLKKMGFSVATGRSAAEMWPLLDGRPADVLILDVLLPDLSDGTTGVDLLPDLQRTHPMLPVIILTGENKVDVAVKAMKRGARDYLVKPVDPELLEITVHQAIEHRNQVEELEALRRGLGALDGLGGMIGTHPSMQLLYAQIENVAPSNVPVLITGESGTGKELVARALHDKSRRARGPFVDINCAAIPRELLESEMFGHEKGAFTGAHRQYVGCFERAHGGTLFLDEICEMDIHLQAKLLRVLQDGKFQRIGGEQKITSDVRIISATNRNPQQAISEGKLREDLYYRLNVVHLHVPALRNRASDIYAIARYYLRRLSQTHGKSFRDFSEEAINAMIACPWKGNVRELINAIEHAVVLNQGELITLDMLPENVERKPRNGSVSPVPADDSGVLPFWLTEKLEIERALRACDGNVGAAAKKLQLSQATLYRKIQKYGLERK
ncbi:MAG: sigma-54 dependent transcriptional regulator [Candidatus Sumerlaeia bacterium]|nr:sigma-54 dependent transcriptional regulator [Candidatus Sumerlaeia bacterium]